MPTFVNSNFSHFRNSKNFPHLKVQKIFRIFKTPKIFTFKSQKIFHIFENPKIFTSSKLQKFCPHFQNPKNHTKTHSTPAHNCLHSHFGDGHPCESVSQPNVQCPFDFRSHSATLMSHSRGAKISENFF